MSSPFPNPAPEHLGVILGWCLFLRLRSGMHFFVPDVVFEDGIMNSNCFQIQALQLVLNDRAHIKPLFPHDQDC